MKRRKILCELSRKRGDGRGEGRSFQLLQRRRGKRGLLERERRQLVPEPADPLLERVEGGGDGFDLVRGEERLW